MQLWDTAYLLEEDDEEEAVEGGQLEAGEKSEAMEEDEVGASGRPAATVDAKGKAKVDDVAASESDDEDSDGEGAVIKLEHLIEECQCSICLPVKRR